MNDNTFQSYTPESRDCIPQETTLTNVKLAQAYVPFQKFCTTMAPLKSLAAGTVFPELWSPWQSEQKIVKERKPWTEKLY